MINQIIRASIAAISLTSFTYTASAADLPFDDFAFDILNKASANKDHLVIQQSASRCVAAIQSSIAHEIIKEDNVPKPEDAIRGLLMASVIAVPKDQIEDRMGTQEKMLQAFETSLENAEPYFEIYSTWLDSNPQSRGIGQDSTYKIELKKCMDYGIYFRSVFMTDN